MVISAEKDFVAIGVLAGEMHHSVRSIEQAAERLGLAPAMRLNRVPHFDGAQVETLRAELSKEKS
jgi:hypothetical protein